MLGCMNRAVGTAIVVALTCGCTAASEKAVDPSAHDGESASGGEASASVDGSAGEAAGNAGAAAYLDTNPDHLPECDWALKEEAPRLTRCMYTDPPVEPDPSYEPPEEPLLMTIVAAGDEVVNRELCLDLDGKRLRKDAQWFQFGEGDVKVTWGIEFPAKIRLRVGDQVSFDVFGTDGEFSEPYLMYTVRDAQGELVLYIGSGWDTSDLSMPPEVSVRDGDSFCFGSFECLTYRFYDLLVTSGVETRTIEYGETATVGRYHFVHAGYEHATSSIGKGCIDLGVARIKVGIAAR
jgi:hypothetical protein